MEKNQPKKPKPTKYDFQSLQKSKFAGNLENEWVQDELANSLKTEELNCNIAVTLDIFNQSTMLLCRTYLDKLIFLINYAIWDH